MRFAGGILACLRGILAGVGNRAGGEGFDPPQRLTHQHVGALAFGGAALAFGVELGTQIVDLGAKVLDEGGRDVLSLSGRILARSWHLSCRRRVGWQGGAGHLPDTGALLTG